MACDAFATWTLQVWKGAKMKTIHAILLLLFASAMVLYLIVRPWTPLCLDMSIIALAIIIAIFDRIKKAKEK